MRHVWSEEHMCLGRSLDVLLRALSNTVEMTRTLTFESSWQQLNISLRVIRGLKKTAPSDIYTVHFLSNSKALYLRKLILLIKVLNTNLIFHQLMLSIAIIDFIISFETSLNGNEFIAPSFRWWICILSKYIHIYFLPLRL